MTTPKTFADLGVPATLVSALADRGITAPFPIQINTLPDTMAGRDVLGRGKTGSGVPKGDGKAAHRLPVIRLLAEHASKGEFGFDPVAGTERRFALRVKPTG